MGFSRTGIVRLFDAKREVDIEIQKAKDSWSIIDKGPELNRGPGSAAPVPPPLPPLPNP